MTAAESGYQINLMELRANLTAQVALAVLVGVGAALVVLIGQWPFPLFSFGILAAAFGLAWIVRSWSRRSSQTATHLLVWGLLALLLCAMVLFAEPWIPFLAPVVIIVSAMLIERSGFICAVLVGAGGAWLAASGTRAYPFVELMAVLAASAVLTSIATRAFYTALDWAWTMQQEAAQRLEVVQEHRAELHRALKSLDIADSVLRRANRDLAAARRQAEQARQIKEQFAANVSHELRTPLNLILGFSEIMCLSPEVYGRTDWPAALRQDVFQIYRSSRHLLEMIDDILDLSRFEIAGFTLNREPTQLAGLVRDAVEMSQHLFRARDICLETMIADDLPMLEVDRTRIRQVLLNLLANAARFTEHGVVRVEVARGPGDVLISVADTGAGIPADKLAHLFEEFYQVDRALQRQREGTGLGLAISKHFVQAHDGRIWAESQEGIGSKFTFSLPIPGEHVPVSMLLPGHPVEEGLDRVTQPVFVVDPDGEVLSLVRRYLQGYPVIRVEETDLAEEIARQRPRAIVCNVPPGRLGNDENRVSERLTALPVPIITCSLPSHAWLAEDLGVVACLNKPITSGRLLQEVQRLGEVRDVMVVDDDRAFCRLIERMLTADEQTYQVRQAYDGDEALRAMRERRPDLLLLDLIMPSVDGFQVRETMQHDEALATVPVILLTASGYAQDALTQRAHGIVVEQPGGLKPSETLLCLEAIVRTLQPHYEDREPSVTTGVQTAWQRSEA